MSDDELPPSRPPLVRRNAQQPPPPNDDDDAMPDEVPPLMRQNAMGPETIRWLTDQRRERDESGKPQPMDETAFYGARRRRHAVGARFYCVKCRAKRMARIAGRKTARNGRKYVTAACPRCRTKMCRFIR